MLEDQVDPERECSLQTDLPYRVCLGTKSFQSSLDAVGQGPLYYRSRIAVAAAAFNVRLDDEAINWYQDAISMVPSSWILRNELADVYIQTGQPEEALQPLKESLVITGDTVNSAKALLLQGLTYRELGQTEKSIQSFKRLLSLDSDYGAQARQLLAQPYLDRGNDLSDRGQQDLAIFEYDEAIRLNPEDANSYVLRGNSYSELGRHERGIDDFDRAIELDSGKAEVYRRRGDSYAALGQHDKAFEDYAKAEILRMVDSLE